MLITWIDKKSSLLSGKKQFKAGDVVPAGIIPENRLEKMVADKKIRIGNIVVDKTVKTKELYGRPIEVKVTAAPEKVEPADESKPETRAERKARERAEREAVAAAAEANEPEAGLALGEDEDE